MKTRVIVTVIFAVFLIFIVIAVAGLITYLNWMPGEKYAYETVWKSSFNAAEALKIIDLTGDGKDDVFIQNTNQIRILGVDARPIFERTFPTTITTTMGDVTNDGIEDLIAFSPDQVEIFSRGAEYKIIKVSGLTNPARAAVIRFGSGVQIILGDQSNNLLSINPEGKELWRYKFNYQYAVRGLDDAQVGGQPFLAAASNSGQVSLFDEQGKVRWNYLMSGNLRRLRSYDLNGDGTSEILVGGDSGRLFVLNANTGKEITSNTLGQAVVEIREAELDGKPEAREYVAGGKEGGIWAFHSDGKELWSGSLSERVSAIMPLDIDGDGKDEIIFGDEDNKLTVVNGLSGDKFSLASLNSAITRLDAGRLTASKQLLVTDGGTLTLMTLRHETASLLRFLPLLVGLIISMVITVVAWLIATNPPKPVLKGSLEDQSLEALQSERRMLHESIADVERLKQSGEMTADAYLARLKELRARLAENETAYKKAGIPITIETFKCPQCGGTLPLGVDKCDYCGQTVLT
jgi:outer membrane protein assembly factor BamB